MTKSMTKVKLQAFLLMFTTAIIITFLSSFMDPEGSKQLKDVSSTPSTTYYISNNGNDNHSGVSKDKSWKTIAKVNEFGANIGFKPGDRICFKGGDTFDDAVLKIVNSGTANKPIVFCSYGDGKAHLTQSGIEHDEIIQVLDQKYFTIENLEISNPDFDMSKVTRGIRIELTKEI